MTIDAVIPVYRPDDKFERLLKGLREQSVKLNKIIIMYTRDSETDHCRADGPDIEVHELSKNEFDHGGTRNKGVGFSEAEHVLLMTCDAVPADRYLTERLLEGFADKKTAVCYARQLPAEDASLSERFSREFNYPGTDRLKSAEDIKTMGIKAFFCSNVCAMYRRDIFNELGGFVDRTVFNEDMIFARKALDAGYCIQYKSDARVIHSHNFTNLQQFKRNMLIAGSQMEHPEVFGDVSSESEGVRYVKNAYAYFRKNRQSLMILPFVVTCGFRFAGYRVGKYKYRRSARSYK
ncbi:MAG TPA: glycosyl transferase family 2 [Lachnospiraceae bacterium]|nr:glycosyl transferase family 2 [Lachnospiraceae bacterium]